MAFTKTPQQSTYQTKSISLLREYNSRNQSITKDVDNLNCVFEIIKNKLTDEQEFNVTKRAGTSVYASSLPSTNTRGLYYWEDEDKLLVAVDDDIRIITASTGATVTTLNAVFLTSSGEVGFTEFLYDNNSVKICATDGSRLVTIDTANTVVNVTDPDLPSPHLPQPIFLDGYLFIVKSDSADIYNSDLNDPTSWTSGNFISAEMFPDTVLRIAKLNNYIVCFGSSSIEYFWDAANASGSPLQRNDTPVKLYGYLGGFAQHGNKIYFCGNTSTGTPDVFVLEDFKLDQLGTFSLRKYLEVLDVSFDNIFGNCISFFGHDYYVLNVNTALTYMCDLDTKLWTRLAYQNTSTFGMTNATNVKITSEYSSVFLLSGSNRVHRFDQGIYQDNNVNFTMRIVTDRQMFDTYNQKFMYRLIINSDRPTGSTNVSVYWSDDDYQTYTTARLIDLNQELPSLHQLGRFRRRAFKLEFTDDFPLRVKNFEVDINIGQH